MRKTMLTGLLAVLLTMSCLTLSARPVVSITDFTGANGLNGNKVTGMTTDRRGLLWISTWGGLYHYDGYQFTAYKIRPGDGNELDNARIDDVQKDRRGNLICRSYDEYYLFDFATNKFRRLSHVVGMSQARRRLHQSGVFCRDGYRLRVQEGELSYYDEAARRWQPLVGSIKLARVHATGVVWALMQDDTFCRIVVSRRRYENIDPGEHVLTLYQQPDGPIWQANNDGSVALRSADGRKLGYLNREGGVGSTKTDLSRIYAITSDPQGRIYLGTRLDGLYVLTPQGTRYHMSHYTHQPDDPYSLSNDEVFSLFPDGSDVWIGTLRGGLNLMRTEGGRTVFLHHGNRCPNFPKPASLYGIRTFAKTADGVIAISTSDGIYTFQSRTEAPEHIRFYHSARVNDNPRSLASNGTMSVSYIEGQGLFVCTSHAGLCRATSKELLHDDLEFETWNTERGAPSDQTLQVFADDDRQVWVIYEQGFSRLDVATMTSTDFMENATPHRHTLAVPVRLSDGSVCLPATDGLLKTSLHTLGHQPGNTPILITALTANGSSVPYSLNADTLRLTKEQRNFTIEFAAVEMAGTEHVEYAYRLEGRDRQWNTTGRNRTLSFFNLGAGTYRLLIRATDNDRHWSQQARRVTIVVEPTFWETPWAWLLYAVAGLLLLGAVILIVMYIYRLRLNADFEQRMTEMKLRYFTNLSHELRTPLTLIEGPVTEMLEDTTLPERQRGYLSLVHHNARRMLTLVNQILDFRKIQNSKMTLLVERLDLRKELEEVMGDFRYLARDQQTDFTLVDLTDGDHYVWGDRDKTQKIFFNLLSNAFKYTAPGQRIWIELSGDGQTLSAAVCDTGKGIPQHALSRLFARFETLVGDNYMKSSTGIGLSLVKELATLHHARLSVESREGEGSRFKVTFLKGSQHFQHDGHVEFAKPANRQPSQAPSEEQPAGGQPAPAPLQEEHEGGTTTIMIVEDDAEMLQFVSGILSADYRVLQAVDGQDGLEKAGEAQPDLIISDVNMPRMNGWQMVEALKSGRETSHIPIVLLTANSTQEDRIRGAALGVDDYVVKPFSTKYLRVRVAAIVQKQRQQQQRFMDNYTLPQPAEVVKVELPSDNSGVERRLVQMDTDMMEKLKDFMELHLSESTSVQDMAAHVGMSRTLFYNKIRTITGLTPIDFYRKYHIERAAQMMRVEGMTVAEACYSTGFSDPKYFSKVFKKYIGITPSEYRSGKPAR